MLITLLTGFINFFITDVFPKASLATLFTLAFIIIATMTIFFFERKKITNVVIGKIKPVIHISNNVSFKNRGSICIDGVYYYPYKSERDINMIPQLYNTGSNPTFLVQVGYQNIVKIIFEKDYILFNQIIKNNPIEIKN
jgi:hypothetical protein